MSGLEEAALAFQGEISPTKSNAASKEAPERMFGNVGELEDDQDDQEDEGLDGNGVPDPDIEGADDSDGVEDTDDQPDDIDEDDKDEPEEGQLDLDTEVEVTVDGKPHTVKLGEALNGYIRTQTFHTRLNQLNEARNIIRREAAAVAGQRTKYTGLIETMERELEALTPKEPDWDVLYNEDPRKARELQKQFEQIKAVRAQLSKQKTDAKTESDTEDAARIKEYADTEFSKFISAVPSIKSNQDLAKELQSMQRTGKAAGFTDEELRTVYDSRMLLILQKASKYDRMMAAKPKADQRGAKPVAPGAGTRKGTAPKGLAKANQRLSRSGSIDDAAAVFAQVIK